jgi:hypothetical protein
MPAVKVERINSRAPLPLLLNDHIVGPDTGANTVSRFLGQTPTAGGPLQLTRVLLLPSADIALDADATTFSVQNVAGTVTYASVTNAAAITAAAGVALTLTSNAASIPAGTLLRGVAVNVVSGQVLNTTTLNFQAEFQPV